MSNSAGCELEGYAADLTRTFRVNGRFSAPQREIYDMVLAAQAAAILRGMAGVNLVGGDVVEVSPPFDHAGITAVAAAHVAVEILCLWGWTRRRR